MAEKNLHEQAIDRVSRMTDDGILQATKDVYENPDLLRKRVELEQARGHIRTSYRRGSRGIIVHEV